ncbi:MAG: hypothetical protein VYB44_07170 [Bacteroidota bacterium]|nr:hypothetical protein [Bacteroidota bacterium]
MAEIVGNEFEIGDFVYLITDTEALKRVVSGICLRENGVSYELACGPYTSWHYAFEITKDKPVVSV